MVFRLREVGIRFVIIDYNKVYVEVLEGNYYEDTSAIYGVSEAKSIARRNF